MVGADDSPIRPPDSTRGPPRDLDALFDQPSLEVVYHPARRVLDVALTLCDDPGHERTDPGTPGVPGQEPCRGQVRAGEPVERLGADQRGLDMTPPKLG